MVNRNSLRIIGGKWRRRRLQFVDSPQIRPTPDRVRETLFNWLDQYLFDARCLDLFAGSGALGFEAVSRGAQHALLIEKDARTVAAIRQQKELFQTSDIAIERQDALHYLRQNQQVYDIIFLDPPYASALLERSLTLLTEKQFLSPHGHLYVESSSMQASVPELEALKCVHEKVAGEVRYALYRYQ